jgi:hypothetical protein
VENDPDFPETARLIRGAFGLPEPDKSQHNVPINTSTQQENYRKRGVLM